jgi:hypothetical protein
VFQKYLDKRMEERELRVTIMVDGCFIAEGVLQLLGDVRRDQSED